MPIFWTGPFLLVWDLLVMSKMMWVKFSTFVIIWKVKMAGKLFWVIHPSFGQVCLLLFETFRLLVMSKSCGSSSPYLILCFNKYGENGWKVLLGRSISSCSTPYFYVSKALGQVLLFSIDESDKNDWKILLSSLPIFWAGLFPPFWDLTVLSQEALGQVLVFFIDESGKNDWKILLSSLPIFFWAGPFFLLGTFSSCPKKLWVKFSTFLLINRVKMAGKFFWV